MGTSPSKVSEDDALTERYRIVEKHLTEAVARLNQIVIELKEMNGR